MSLWVHGYPVAVEVRDSTVDIFTETDSELTKISLSFGTHDNPDGHKRLSRFVAVLVDGVTGGTGGRVSLKEEQ